MIRRRVRSNQRHKQQQVGQAVSVSPPSFGTASPTLTLALALPRSIELLKSIEDELKKIRIATDAQTARTIVIREFLEVAWANHVSTQRGGIRSPTTIDGFLVV